MLARLLPILLLLGSNIFMTFAWYGHLKYRSAPLLLVIVASWAIAFFEYSLMVPANRLGSTVYSVVQLKTIQEVITLVVFAGFSAWYLGQPLKWNHYAAFVLIIGAAFLMFYQGPGAETA
ncbi:DMT family protein [Pseudoxanthomonas dokdonensis]|uniref:Membrane protein n=1 Tax=Pseudoxanthomonas dokdonensis TaxID=344882 RepID=A0A0R0CZ62_9GAMM|nr:DMT family protein [Pseudoxanthomonas dokdonensis]KRG71454.1 membrane protein [Pseudoxanthomonas dokdonensis]